MIDPTEFYETSCTTQKKSTNLLHSSNNLVSPSCRLSLSKLNRSKGFQIGIFRMNICCLTEKLVLRDECEYLRKA